MTASTHTEDRPDIHDWHLGDIAVFDTETTGTDVEADRIVSAYFGIVTLEGEIVKFREWLIRPDILIPAGATAVHGITNEFVAENGEEPATALAEILDCFAAAATALIPVVIYNAPFDLTLLDREARRHLGRPLALRCPVLDPLVLDKHFDQYRPGSRTLSATCAFYGVELTGAHEASADALATGALVRVMVAKYPKLAAAGLRALWVSQRQWALKQQGGLAEHFLRKAAQMEGAQAAAQRAKAESVRLAWPVIRAQE